MSKILIVALSIILSDLCLWNILHNLTAKYSDTGIYYIITYYTGCTLASCVLSLNILEY
jgi:hypothetical protein